jgi:hypothetical protein
VFALPPFIALLVALRLIGAPAPARLERPRWTPV